MPTVLWSPFLAASHRDHLPLCELASSAHSRLWKQGCLGFGEWLLPLRVTFVRSLHLVTFLGPSFCFFVGKIIHPTGLPCFDYHFIDRHLGYSHFWVAVMILKCSCLSMYLCGSMFLTCCSVVGTQVCRVILF